MSFSTLAKNDLGIKRVTLKASVLLVFSSFIAVSLMTFRPAAQADEINTSDFVTVWKTDNPGTSCDSCITIPTNGGGFNYDIDWNNDGVFDQLGATSSTTHDFVTPGEYTIRIRGSYPEMGRQEPIDPQKLIEVKQWGSIDWRSMEYAFRGALNVEITAEDAPDLSDVTNMASMFLGATNFDSDIGHWDTSNVTNMASMFYDAWSFNQDISEWDTSSVTLMDSMFLNANTFNQNLPDWDTSNVTTMRTMFADATSFDGDISGWDTGQVANMSGMFSGASTFSGDVSDWDTGSVTDMRSMFSGATAFDGDLSVWDTSGVTDMAYMFMNAGSFTSDLSNWDTGSVTSFYYTFGGASTFNSDLTNWDTSSATDMMSMFTGATNFNGDVSGWDTSNVVTMSNMFLNASSFNQDLSSWDVSSASNMYVMLSGSALSSEHYDAFLKAISGQSLQPSVYFGVGPAYCFSASYRQSIIDSFNWVISDDGISCSAQLSVWSVDSGVSEGSNIGTLSLQAASPRGVNPFTLTCSTPGADDESFSVLGSGLIAEHVFDYDVPLDANQDNTYEFCIRSFNEAGDSVETTLTLAVAQVVVPPEKAITGVNFLEDNGKKILIVTGVYLLGVSDTDINKVLSEPMVSLNGSNVPFCSDGIGLTAAEIVGLGISPELVSDGPPCYYYMENGGYAISGTQVKVWLPDTFNITSEGTIAINDSDIFTFNPASTPEEPSVEPQPPVQSNTSGEPVPRPNRSSAQTVNSSPGELQEPKPAYIFPTIDVDGDKPINKHPVIPKRPTFNGLAAPTAEVTVTITPSKSSCADTASSAGNWRCTPATDLDPGEYTIDTTVVNPDGSVVKLDSYQATVLGDTTNEASGSYIQNESENSGNSWFWPTILGTTIFATSIWFVVARRKKKTQ